MDFIIKKGTELFHSTGEPFEDGDLNVGGFDKVLWTAMESAISQAYIPKAGSSLITNTRTLSKPSEMKSITEFQRKHIGLEYDDVKWEHGQARSWRTIKTPIPWDPKDYDRDKKLYAVINNVLMSAPFKYTPRYEDSYAGDHQWMIHYDDNGSFAPADYFKKGRLFILKPKRDLKLYDMTHGGSEGDLNDRDYYKHDLFRQMEAEGYDGVKINDHAQTEELGNFGHFSYGLFKSTLGDLDREVLPGVQHPMNLDAMYRADKADWHSQEYRKHRGLAEAIARIIREEFRQD